jgi:hypothetical protein
MAKKSQKNPTDMCLLIEASAKALLDQARLLRTLHATQTTNTAATRAVQKRRARLKVI